MNKRTKFLLAALAVVGGGVLADQGYRRFVELPAQRREREASRMARQIEDAEDTIFKSGRAADELSALERFSLPHDQELARARYQEWLLTLVEDVDLQRASVDAGEPVAIAVKDRDTGKPKEIARRYTFSLRGSGTLRQVTRLLFLFYQGSHLHKIRSLSLVPAGSSGQLDVLLGIEALGLAHCEREGELSTAAVHRLASSDLVDYQPIVRRNLFLQAGGDVLRELTLTAVTVDRGGALQAWFSGGTNAPTQVAQRGGPLQAKSHSVEVVDIMPNSVLLDVDGELVSLSLGQTVHHSLTDSAHASDVGHAVVR